MLKRLFEISGMAELLSKRLAYSVNSKQLKELYHKIFLHKGEKVKADRNNMKLIFSYLDSLGIKKGDILLVHSSFDGMKTADPDAKEIIDYLLNLVGKEGTLVFPAFPIINLKNVPGKIQTYNPKRTLCWTGTLPNTFLTYDGVERSLFPYNTLAAVGAHAKDMMKNNLLDEVPHGNNSAWAYCVDHDAKILYLGVSIAECNTVLHTADDRLGDKWPIKDWYDTLTYKIKTSEGTIEKTIKVAKGFWVRYNTCYNFNGKLKRLGFMTETVVGGVNIGYTKSSKKLMEYVIAEAEKGRIRYRIPKKYWKD
jgi:aminoglycoside 3-N-acetyltransferase